MGCLCRYERDVRRLERGEDTLDLVADPKVLVDSGTFRARCCLHTDD